MDNIYLQIYRIYRFNRYALYTNLDQRMAIK